MLDKLYPVALALSLFAACRPTQTTVVGVTASREAKGPWTSLAFNDDPERFQFAIVTDRTGGHRPGVFEDAIRKLNLLQPDFVMSVGDLIEGYTEDERVLDRQWTEFQAFTAALDMPFFYVPGNHDLSNLMQVEKWKERFGQLYWHLVYKDVLLLGLDSEDPPDTHISDAQVAYVKKALDENPKVRWTLLFLHKPLWVVDERRSRDAKGTAEPPKETGWPKIEALLSSRPYTVFAGHFHNYTKYVRHDRRYFVLATTGGASKLRGPVFGEFDHVMWVTMAKDGPIVANLMLGGIWDENVTTEQSRAMLAGLERAISIGALFLGTSDRTFGGGTVPIKITNDADQPLHVKGRFRPNLALVVDPPSIDETISPNSVRQIDFKIRLPRPLKSAELPALTLDTLLSYEVADGPKLSIELVHSIAPERVEPIPRRKAPVVVDGKLDEWRELPVSCLVPKQILRDADAWQGAADASFRFAVQHDGTNLYVAVETTDERLVTLPGKPPGEQDGIEVRIDARPEPERTRARDDFKDVLVLAAFPSDGLDQTNVMAREKLPPGVQVACVKTKRGHITEIAVPVSLLDATRGGPWQRVRLNIAVNDLDEPSATPSQIWWRPDWRTEANYAGSGTFERSK